MSTLTVAWYAPGTLPESFIAEITRSAVAHVGCAIDGVYINVGPPRLNLLSYVPAGAFTTQTFTIPDTDAARGLAYMHALDGTPYGWSTIAADLANAALGTHLEVSRNGECVCSGVVAGVLVRVGLLEDTMPDQETPQSLLDKLGGSAVTDR